MDSKQYHSKRYVYSSQSQAPRGPPGSMEDGDRIGAVPSKASEVRTHARGMRSDTYLVLGQALFGLILPLDSDSLKGFQRK